MSPRRAKDLLADLRELCEETLQHAATMQEEEFYADKAKQRVLERTIELIGEASIQLHKVAPELNLPWSQMRAMRNLLAHAYHKVDAAIVWRTAHEDVPVILEQISALD